MMTKMETFLAIVAGIFIIGLSLVLGIELPLYVGITILGVGLLLHEEDPIVNYVGGYMTRTGIVLIIVAFLFYLFAGEPLIGEPFEFKFLRTFVTMFIRGWVWGSNIIGDVIFRLISGEGVNETIFNESFMNAT